MTESPSHLIMSAFEQARSSGKPNWRQMTIAVLKNRLLSITHGEFDTSLYDVHSMRDFVDLARDIVTIDTTKYPPVVILLDQEDGERETERLPTKAQIRPDLWQAILDYSRGSTFVWDQSSKRAREALPDDDNLPVFPTISESDLREWRKLFADRHALLALDDIASERLRDWQERVLPSRVLPKPLATEWLAELKSRVVDSLRTWFTEHGIAEPPDLLQSFVPLRIEEPKSERSNVEALRQMVIQCVEVMSETELSDLRFSPATLLRASQGQKRRAR